MLLTLALNRYRSPENLTLSRALAKLRVATGVQLVETCDVPDVSLARCLLLTTAMQRPSDVVLVLDDDIVVTADQLQELARDALRLRCAVSARYARSDGHLAARRRRTDARWVTGLGCIAIPTPLLEGLDAPQFVVEGDRIARLFCVAHVNGGVWCPEDYHLSARLGGVVLSSIVVGHLKGGVALYPPEDE